MAVKTSWKDLSHNPSCERSPMLFRLDHAVPTVQTATYRYCLLGKNTTFSKKEGNEETSSFFSKNFLIPISFDVHEASMQRRQQAVIYLKLSQNGQKDMIILHVRIYVYITIL